MSRARLDTFVAQVSTDLVKTDLELRCSACGECLCDIEDGDDLLLLTEVAHQHQCPPKTSRRDLPSA